MKSMPGMIGGKYVAADTSIIKSKNSRNLSRLIKEY